MGGKTYKNIYGGRKKQREKRKRKRESRRKSVTSHGGERQRAAGSPLCPYALTPLLECATVVNSFLPCRGYVASALL